MCGNGGHLCPKVTHIFKNCRFHQCVNDMLRQIPVPSASDRKNGNSREYYIDGTVGNGVTYYYNNDMRNVTMQRYSGGSGFVITQARCDGGICDCT